MSSWGAGNDFSDVEKTINKARTIGQKIIDFLGVGSEEDAGVAGVDSEAVIGEAHDQMYSMPRNNGQIAILDKGINNFDDWAEQVLDEENDSVPPFGASTVGLPSDEWSATNIIWNTGAKIVVEAAQEQAVEAADELEVEKEDLKAEIADARDEWESERGGDDWGDEGGDEAGWEEDVTSELEGEGWTAEGIDAGIAVETGVAIDVIDVALVL